MNNETENPVNEFVWFFIGIELNSICFFNLHLFTHSSSMYSLMGQQHDRPSIQHVVDQHGYNLLVDTMQILI